MKSIALQPLGIVRSRLRVPGDKSIAHRSLILNAMAEGCADVHGLPDGADVAATAAALTALGARVESRGDVVSVTGVTSWAADAPIDCGNSGTSARLLLGALAGRARGPVTLRGDRSLSRRPMRRVVGPLSRMGAQFDGADRLPITVTGARLTGRRFELPIASAQVKSAILLAGLSAAGETIVVESGTSRDHTERMLAAMGARIGRGAGGVHIERGPLAPLSIAIPGDVSSAAPFFALAAAREGSEVVVEGVGVNPTRTGFLDLVRAFGAEVEIETMDQDPEPVGTVRVRGGALTAIDVAPDVVPRAIDELPLVAVLATQARGVTRVRGAAELRVKESDRIATIAAGLRAMGAEIEVADDGFAIEGFTPLAGAPLDAAGDHRIGMALAIAASLAAGPSALDGAEWVDVSYPSFFEDLHRCAESIVGA